MGYRSEVLIKIDRTDPTPHPLDSLWTQHLNNQPKILSKQITQEWADQITMSPDTWLFHTKNIRWHTASQNQAPIPAFAHINIIDTFRIEITKMIHRSPGSYSLTHIRVGEEPGDIHLEYLGKYNPRNITTRTTIVGL